MKWKVTLAITAVTPEPFSQRAREKLLQTLDVRVDVNALEGEVDTYVESGSASDALGVARRDVHVALNDTDVLPLWVVDHVVRAERV